MIINKSNKLIESEILASIQKPATRSYQISEILKDLLPSIFSYLDSNSFNCCFRVCKEWNQIAKKLVEKLQLKRNKLMKEMIFLQNKSSSLQEKFNAFCANQVKNWRLQPVSPGEMKKYTYGEIREEVKKAHEECFTKDQAFIKADNALKKLLGR